jgi:hypothetical protein
MSIVTEVETDVCHLPGFEKRNRRRGVRAEGRAGARNRKRAK